MKKWALLAAIIYQVNASSMILDLKKSDDIFPIVVDYDAWALGVRHIHSIDYSLYWLQGEYLMHKCCGVKK